MSEENDPIKIVRERVCHDMDNVLPLHSPQWDYAKDVLYYLDNPFDVRLPKRITASDQPKGEERA